MSINTEIIINAPIERVTKTFFDFPNHKNWNPFFNSIEVLDGKSLQVGSQLKVEIQLPNRLPQTFKPYVTELTAQSLKWKGTLLFEFIASGVHSFQFIPLTIDNKQVTKVIQSEQFIGIFFALATGIIKESESQFKKLNEALKREVEE